MTIRQRKPIKRGVPPKKRNLKRRASEFARCYGSKARVEFVKSLGCIYCTAVHPFFGLATAGTSHNAHTVGGGAGRKADYTTIIPLCASHHRCYDERRSPLDDERVRAAIASASEEVERRWLAFSGGDP